MLKVASFFKEENDPFFRRGEEKGEIKKSYEIVENLLIKLGLSNEKAAEIAEVSVDFVQKVRADLAKKKKN
ncbi:hypothetical protein RYH73_19465 [Olivibacter sp. CPCC 100613]|uniref:hypothetical protein n=1 Tax=Olivibacter sp. CPCC 100613 TaxID=3079931 RepID=UPI002FF7FEBA